MLLGNIGASITFFVTIINFRREIGKMNLFVGLVVFRFLLDLFLRAHGKEMWCLCAMLFYVGL